MMLRRIAYCFYLNQRHFTTKLSIILLLWHFSTSFLYNLLLRQPSYFQLDNTNIGILTATFLKTPFLFSPLAGFLADARFGRIYDIMAHSNDDVFNFCWENATYTTHKNYITIPSSYISTVQQILLAISETLLYISAIEFICCQSPQKMKGILYGLFYALKSFYQDLSTPIIFSFAHH